jgi:integrase
MMKLSARAKRFYTDCDCKIWLTGTTDNERYPRQSLGMTDWKAAEAQVASLIAGSKDTTVHGPTIADCIRRFLEAHKDNVKRIAYGQHRLTLSRLEAYTKSRNKTFMSDLTVDLLEDFKTDALSNLRSTSKATFVAKLRYFLREAYRRGWITESLAEKVRPTRAVYEQTQPFSDAEVATILDRAERLAGGTTGYSTNGRLFRLLLELMLETGLRVGDAIRYDPSRCTKSEHLWIYKFTPKKQRKNEKAKQAEVFINDRLKLAIDHARWFSEHLPFAYRTFADNSTMESAVYERMQRIGERCGIADCRPHRLRDTFAVRMLLRGMSLEDVSQLLGHGSVAVTQKHYAPWVPSRRLRLEGVLAQALVDPRGN